eukprot:207511-Prorocentrum_minimum.AAC.1
MAWSKRSGRGGRWRSAGGAFGREARNILRIRRRDWLGQGIFYGYADVIGWGKEYSADTPP